jgi:hypothetical protein
VQQDFAYIDTLLQCFAIDATWNHVLKLDSKFIKIGGILDIISK